MKFLTFFIVYLSEIESKKCFKIYKDSSEWASALKKCKDRLNKGTLAVIESEKEYFDLKDRYDFDHVSTGYNMWLGIYRAAMQVYGGSKYWRIREFHDVADDRSILSKRSYPKSSYWRAESLWNDDEPNNNEGLEYCVEYYLRDHKIRFNDRNCQNKLSFACQYEC